MIVYIAGPYRGNVEANIQAAREIAAEVWRVGHVAICPHLNTAHFDRDYPDIPDQAYLDGDLEILARCDAMVLVPGWRASQGTQAEVAFAEKATPSDF